MKKTNKNKHAFQVGTHDQQVLVTVPHTAEDFKNSLLIVSVVLNIAVLTTWLVTQVNGESANAIATLITS
jgi:hypothetical protein